MNCIISKSSKARKITRALSAVLFGALIFSLSGCGDDNGSNNNSSTDDGLPAAPTGVTATAISSSEITISWNAVSGAVGYYVYRGATSSGTFSQVGTTTATTHTNTGLAPETIYYYRVAAYNGEGTGEQSSAVSAETGYDELVDSRDGKTYRYVTIGTQTWMAENLNYATSSGSWCYDNDPANCAIYGRLYDWNTALTACPAGWHLPDSTELRTLLRYAANPQSHFLRAGTKLKSSTGWESHSTVPAGTDDFGFSALPGGARQNIYDNISYNHIGEIGNWWTATECNESSAASLMLMNYTETAGDGCNAGGHKSPGFNVAFSVRCVKSN